MKRHLVTFSICIFIASIIIYFTQGEDPGDPYDPVLNYLLAMKNDHSSIAYDQLTEYSKTLFTPEQFREYASVYREMVTIHLVTRHKDKKLTDMNKNGHHYEEWYNVSARVEWYNHFSEQEETNALEYLVVLENGKYKLFFDESALGAIADHYGTVGQIFNRGLGGRSVDYNKAIDRFRTSLSYQETGYSYIQLADIVAYQQQKLDEAIELAAKGIAIAEDPNLKAAGYGIQGYIYLNQNKKTEASTAYQKAMAEKPTDEETIRPLTELGRRIGVTAP
ncbi:tetratricopeptide repeat protein [Brevibacillus dissolubilis]|uniref:tetratricopeptide repeat protein n=1 Tax=Brevibacillus dissolubilis TaxID=1844116 RepID=UPI001115E25D|nr:tetratricopeptide repeat protein [Brevibacillus dissolubilis]